MWIASLFLVTLILFSIPYLRRKILLKHWYKIHHLHAHHGVFSELYADVNGFTLSRQARARQDAIEYTYGEIEFLPFIALLSLVKPHQQTVFYDLGSGTGKAILACAMVFDVKKSCGIELFDTLHQTAVTQTHRLNLLEEYRHSATKIHCRHDNFLNTDFSDATLLFIQATALFGDTWVRLQQRLETLSSGTLLMTTSKPLNAASFCLLKKTMVQMSWGAVITYIQQRI